MKTPCAAGTLYYAVRVLIIDAEALQNCREIIHFVGQFATVDEAERHREAAIDECEPDCVSLIVARADVVSITVVTPDPSPADVD